VESVPIVLGEPGLGKTAMFHEIAKEYAFDHFADLNVSLLDTPDMGGLALIGEQGSDVLHFKKSPLLAPFQTGRNLLVFDEVADANVAMQNLVRRIEWSRNINGLYLSPETFLGMTSNRTIDKSGAGRLTGKIKNTVEQYTLEAHLGDWVDWAQGAGVDPILIQCMRYKPDMLQAYDPNADVSPTCRQWALVSKVPTTLRQDLFHAKVAARVGAGPASVYCAFRALYANLVSFEDVAMDPQKCPIPEKPDALFATVGSLAQHTTATNVDRVAPYIDRLSPEMSTMYWMDVRKKTPAIKGTKSYIKWATANANVVLS
jgi:hypothetical protein